MIISTVAEKAFDNNQQPYMVKKKSQKTRNRGELPKHDFKKAFIVGETWWRVS